MTPTTDQLATLRAAAAAATPGPWEYQTSNGWHRVGTTAANRGRRDGDVVANGAASPANMAYIAAASPAAVLALLDYIDAQATELAEWHKLRDSNALHINLLRGMPARLTTEQLLHIAGDKYQSMAARIAELERDAARYRWLTQDAHIGECFTDRGVVLEICGTDREIPVLHERATDRDEVNAAIDAAIEQQCTS